MNDPLTAVALLNWIPIILLVLFVAGLCVFVFFLKAIFSLSHLSKLREISESLVRIEAALKEKK